ncbi:hypothetical protein L207DRAFT_376138, partial [Hyaloscypha variabilis F]
PTRRLYNGSCHCGFQTYQIYLTLPPPIISPKPPLKETPRFRKCNCTTCHKMSFFHVRLPDSVNDFRLLSPLDPQKELSDYRCASGETHWYFCPKCGVRCFTFMGEGEVREVESEGKVVKFWAPKEPWVEGTEYGSYLSVNAATLEAQQEGLDLREWHEKGWITYLEWLGEKPNDHGEDRMGAPHVGGMY